MITEYMKKDVSNILSVINNAALKYKGVIPDNCWHEPYMSEQELINAGKTNFKGWKCSMGLESLFIQYTGEMYLANCFQGGTIGHINEPENIKWPTQQTVCIKDRCICTTDVLLTKERVW